MRKSLKDISWQVDEETYRADEAYSYSTIAKFHREGFEKLSSLYDKVDSPSLLFGSMVDTLLTDGQEAFDSRFMVAIFPELKDSEITVIKSIFAITGGLCTWDKVSNDTILQAIDECKFQPNWRPETRLKVIKEKGEEYYNLMVVAKDKTLITPELYADAQTCVDLLKTSDATKWYFQEDNPFEEDVERLYQLKFKGEYEGIPLRIMADNIIVDHKNKIIYPTDLKTSYKAEWNFYKSFIEWGYYHQANLYAEIIRQNIEKDEYFKDFKIADYRFIVVCNRTRVPLVWEWSYTKTTVDFKIGDVEFPNWRGIVKQLDYYLREEPPVPEGIVVEDTNNIAKFIEKYGR
jgi:hypothetical protein